MTDIVTHEKIGNIIHVKINADNVLMSEKVAEINKQLKLLINSEPKSKLIVDLAKVQNASSSFFTLLANLQMYINEKQCKAKYVNLHLNLSDFIELTGLNKILDIHATVEKALVSYSQEIYNVKND